MTDTTGDEPHLKADPLARTDDPPVWGGRATWQITLRWLVPPSLLAGVIVGRLLGFGLAVVPILLVAAFVQSYNVVFWLVYVVGKRGEPSAVGRRSPRPAIAQVALDYAAMIVLVYYTGGVASPLLFFFVFHVVFAALVLDARLAWLFACAAVGSVVVLWAGETTGILSPTPISYRGDQCGPLDAAHAALTTLFFGLTVLVVAAETTALVRRMRREHAVHVATVTAMADERARMILQVEHNLRSPLTASVSMLDVVTAEMLGPLSEGQMEYLRRVRRRLMTLNEMVGELLQLARRRAEASVHTRMPCEMGPLLAQVVRHFADQAKEQDITLTVDMSADVPPVMGDANELRQMMENLLSNALKYTPAGGAVAVTLVRSGPRAVEVMVRDTGIGVPEAEKERLFDEFYRAPNARAMTVDGTGLGLTIVKQTVDGHGGSVRIESTEGQGTTVTVLLPAMPDGSTEKVGK